MHPVGSVGLQYNAFALAYEQDNTPASIGLLPISKRAPLLIHFGTSLKVPCRRHVPTVPVASRVDFCGVWALWTSRCLVFTS